MLFESTSETLGHKGDRRDSNPFHPASQAGASATSASTTIWGLNFPRERGSIPDDIPPERAVVKAAQEEHRPDDILFSCQSTPAVTGDPRRVLSFHLDESRG